MVFMLAALFLSMIALGLIPLPNVEILCNPRNLSNHDIRCLNKVALGRSPNKD